MPVLVAVPVPFLSLLTYDVPDGATPPVRGARVLVPLGTRQVTGCVVGTVAQVPREVELKAVLEVLDDAAFLPEHILDLALWAAEYYVAGPGAAVVLRAMADARSVTTRQLRTAVPAMRGSLDGILRGLVRDGLITAAQKL